MADSDTPLSREEAAGEDQPVVGAYVVTFLKPEMLHIYRQITALQRYRPIVFAQKRENADAFPFEDLVLLPKPSTHALRRIWQKQILRRPITIYRGEARSILAALHERGARLLHIYFGHIGVHLLPLLEIADLPVIVSFHGADAQVGMEKPAHLVRTQRMLKLATRLLVRSQSLAERLIALGADPAKIRLHRTGIPLEQITFHQRSGPSNGAWRCVQACRLIEKKGLATTLRAFASFLQRYPRATLAIAGDGPQLSELRELCCELEIDREVFFTGFLPQEKLSALYAESHLFLHPSELAADGDQEGVPNSMLEAMASGLPVLATRHGGIPEAVEHGASGLLVPERDHTALSLAMLELAADSEKYQQLSLGAARRVAALFDLRVQARVLEDIYSETLATAVASNRGG
jgi:glycosyltransferase involved in cell wall biosynthesis